LDKRITLAIVIAVVSISAVLLYVNLMNTDKPQINDEAPINVESIGGKYDATVTFWEDHAAMEYTDEEGKHTEGYFEVDIRDGLDWIKVNTPEDSVFLCWWDYGHMIKGYTERNVIVRNPSEEIKESIANPDSITEFDPHERIMDVAKALTTSDFNELQQILDKYDVTHVLVCTDDLGKSAWMFHIAGLEPSDYGEYSESGVEFTEAGMQTMIAKLLENRDTGLTLIYEDEEIKIYN
jgi:asparagine N-glycosylation enzyme membrane subunit Stt3